MIATSVTITTEDTSDVPGWDRYRTTGEAFYSYYVSGGGFKKGSTKFEVLTDLKNGKIRVLELAVVP